MHILLRHAGAGLLAAANLVAQSGDKAGERQQPPPSHWIIPPAPVLSPAEQAKSFRLAPGFRAELVAAEPLVRDPVAMVFGPDGRLWVVEVPGYMRDIDATGDTAQREDPYDNAELEALVYDLGRLRPARKARP